LLGKEATETAFKKEPLDQFRVLHLAVHGFADTQYPSARHWSWGQTRNQVMMDCFKYGDHQIATEYRTDYPIRLRHRCR